MRAIVVDQDRTSGAAYPSPARAWSNVAILMVVYTLSFIDRQGISLLVGPIRHDLGISDTGMSLLIGFAFALLYTTLGIPAGAMADRGSRKALLTAGLAVWSVATIGSGLAQSYGELFAARFLVGAGEACLVPAAFSIVHDSFPAGRRGVAFGVFGMGLMVGAGCAFLAGGLLIGSITQAANMDWPIFGQLAPWQAMLVAAGLLGAPALVLLSALQEPVRQDRRGAETTVRDALRYVTVHRRVYAPLFLAIGTSGIVAAGLLSWLPAVLGRGFSLSTTTIGVRYGVALLVLAPIGLTGTGAVINWLVQRGRPNAAPMVGAALALAIVPLVGLAPVAPDETSAWAALAAYLLIGTGIQPAGATTLSAVTPGRLLGRVTALYFLAITALSVLIGPTLIAGASDYLLGGALGRSLALVCAASSLVSAALFALTARRMSARLITEGETA